MTPGLTLGETDYQLLSTALALLFNGKAGMQSSDMHALAKAIGLAPSAYGRGETLAQLLGSDAVKDLKPGEVGQLNWVLQAGSGHAMLLGRHQDGMWFFADQGASPAFGIQRASHAELVSGVVAYAAGGSWLYGGNKQHLQTLPPVTGFTVLGGAQGFLNRGPALLVPGEKLAEIDAGVTTTGEIITAWDYHSRHESSDRRQGGDRQGSGGARRRHRRASARDVPHLEDQPDHEAGQPRPDQHRRLGLRRHGARGQGRRVLQHLGRPLGRRRAPSARRSRSSRDARHGSNGRRKVRS